ncbi:MAG: hypothetical protein HOV80_17660 [Polyangiaceae bacterium]|nr:hypothetical protein [Polyangiaceae bacterium]
MAARQFIVQKGSGPNLFVYSHLFETPEVKKRVAETTSDAVVIEFWGAGTAAYKTVLPAYGGWEKYLDTVAKSSGRERFERVTLTTWSAGSQLAKSVCRSAPRVWPDAIVSLDGIYGSKPPGSKPGDGNVIFDPETKALAEYALAAARGEKILVLLHSDISTPYGSSGECAQLIRRYVEDILDQEMVDDESVTAAELDGHQFREALVLGNFHLLSFPGRDAKEHMREAHLYDEVWTRWIPWMTPPTKAAPATSPTVVLPPPPPAVGVPAGLRVGDKGEEVKAWQAFLYGLGFTHLKIDGDFGPKTESATKAFERDQGLVADGVVDGDCLARARAVGYGAKPPAELEHAGDASWPPPPVGFAPITGNRERAALWGHFDFRPAPTPQFPEGVTILGEWARNNIVTVDLPQLKGVLAAPSNCKVPFHRLGAERLRELFAEWEKRGMQRLLQSWGGSWAPRFIKGSRTTLSNHAWAAAFDINVAWNPLGARPALVGQFGSVRELAAVAGELGWGWGGWYVHRVDGMHFELPRP